MRVVLVIQEEHAVRRHPFRGRITVGRDASCDVRLSDLTVSRKHARIEPRNQSWVIADLESGNGTFVDGNPIEEEVLTGGETLRFGEVSAVFEVEPAEEDLTASQKLKQTLSIKPVRKTRPVAGILVSTLGLLFLLSATAYERGCIGSRTAHAGSESRK